MDRRVATAAGLLGAGAWALQRGVDARRIAADPEAATLFAPLEGHAVAVTAADGTTLHAEVLDGEADDAPTVVLLHGWTCALRFWRYQLGELPGDGLRVVAFDLRGHGRSERPASGDYSMEALADDLQAVLETCVPEGQRAVLAGHSLGAMTIVAWAGRHPGELGRRAAAAALVNTGMGDFVSETLVLRMPSRLGQVKQTLGRAFLTATAPLPAKPMPLTFRGLRYLALSPSASPAQVAFCEELVLGCRRDVRAACGATLAELDLYQAIGQLAVPTIVVAGGRDKLTPPAHTRRLAEALPDLRELVEVPGVGHMAPVEAHEVVSAKLRELAAGVSSVEQKGRRPADDRAA